MLKWIVIYALCIFLFLGCAANQNPNVGTMRDNNKEPAGFWLGLWHGFIVFFAFIVSLFKHSVGIYETHNVGFWYNFGYVIGLIISHGGGAGILFRNKRD